MINKTMKSLTIDKVKYEIYDETARNSIETLRNEVVEVTQEEYDALGDVVNTDGKTYFIKDAENNESNEIAADTVIYANSTSGLTSRNVQKAIDELSTRVNDTNEDLNVQTLRIDQFVAIKDGATTGDIELQDIRIGADGVIYETAGTAVRSQVGEINDQIKEILAKKDFASVEFDEETRLLHFLDGNGEDVYEPVRIEGGGGGTGGSVTTTAVKLTNQNGTSTFTIASGGKIELKFNFTSTEDDIATGNGTCQISVNGSLKSTFSIEQGLTTVDVSEFLSTGSNTVRVKCMDIYGNYKSLVYTVTVIDLSISSTFDPFVTYNSSITFKYTPYGAIEKTIHMLIDGKEINTTTTSVSGKQMTYVIPAMSHGIHKLEVYMTAELDDVEIDSNRLVYDVMCVEENDTTPMIASVYTVTSITQGGQISIPYVVYDPTKLACDITLTVYTMSNGSEVVYSTQEITVDRGKQTWNTRKYPVGTVYFRIKYGNIFKAHCVTVKQNEINVEAETNDLELHLSSEGRSNNEPNPSVWTYGDVVTSFENINWSSTGWINDENGDTCLRLNGDARAEIQFKPFAEDIRTYGKTIELEFAVRDVNNRNATVISCMSGDIGFEVKADTAYLNSEQSNVFCNYKDEEKVRLSFVVESRSEHRLLSIYLNGILSDTIQYPDSDSFQQTSPVNISIGSSNCGVDLYTVRSYSTALTSQGIVNNYIADMVDIVEKTETYEENDIYDEYKNISFEKAKEKNSVMVIVGPLPESKGDKKTVSIDYYDIDDSNLSYSDSGVTIDVQGTSSQWSFLEIIGISKATVHSNVFEKIIH